MKNLIPFLILISLTLRAQSDDSWKVFDDTQVGRVDITIDTAYLSWIFAHPTSDSEFVATMRFRNRWFDETVDSVGFRLRGNTSRQAQKKSFKVAINSFFSGRQFHGVEKLNLNGEHNDPSIVRSKISFDLFGKAGLIASRACHTEVYINGRYYGLYINVEHIDEEFLKKRYADDSGNLWKCLWPADLKYLGENPQAYITLGGGRPAYELSTNEAGMDFSKLIRLTRLLRNTPATALPDSLETTLDVTSAMKYFAMNILTGQWDDYWSNMNNYYLYHEPAEEVIHVIPYDYDNTFGIDWFNTDWMTVDPYNFPRITAGERPLAEKLLQVPQFRNLYTRMLRFYRDRVFALQLQTARLDNLRDMITPFAIPDTFRTKDYGFTFNHFLNSYSTSFNYLHVKKGLKQYIFGRANSLAAQLSDLSAPPMVYNYEVSPANPAPADSVEVRVSAFSAAGLRSVTAVLTNTVTGDSVTRLMVWSPVPGTQLLEENDLFTAKFPPLGPNARYRITFRLIDSANTSAVYPRSKKIEIKTPGEFATGVKINEFLADNTAFPDTTGDFDDYLELYNSSNEPVTLTGMYLTDNRTALTKWRFEQPGLVIQPNAFLVVWCDEDLTDPGIHTNFKLSKSGEEIFLTAPDGVTVLDSIIFGPQTTNVSFGRLPDGGTEWFPVPPTPGYTNVPVSVEDETLPAGYSLGRNYPNPFSAGSPSGSSTTSMDYTVKEGGELSLKVYNSLGEEVAVVAEGFVQPGRYTAVFESGDLPSGVYFLRMAINGYSQTIKMTLLR
ncbi:MAG: hypothetical protein AMXMBFR49_20300 [Chlorobiota bacterium]